VDKLERIAKVVKQYERGMLVDYEFVYIIISIIHEEG
jgi:hypothetical protein